MVGKGNGGSGNGSSGKPIGSPSFPSSSGKPSEVAEATIPRQIRELGCLLAAARDAAACGSLIFDPQIATHCQERGTTTILPTTTASIGSRLCGYNA